VQLQTRSITASKCISRLPRLWPASLHDHGLQVHLQTRLITASKCISEFTRSQSLSVSPNTLDHGLHVHDQRATVVVRRYRGNGGGQNDGECIIGRPRSRLTPSHFHLLLSYHENSPLIFPNFWSHSLCARFRGSSWPGSIISSHLQRLLEFNIEGTQGEIFAASPLALQSRCKGRPNEPNPTYGHSWPQRQSVYLK